ncbi:hypothetical protein YC2023_072629 [Brassica napus]
MIPMASSKGKGPLYQDDDDEPILLPDQADESLIKEYSLSLIGKILNPKKQNVERLIVAMPEQWGIVRQPRQDEASRVNAERGKEESSYRSLNDGSSSTSRVQRSTHSNRVNRINSSRDSRCNPYSSVRNKGQEKRFPPRDKEWKEKQRPLRIVEPVRRSMDRDTDHTSMNPRTANGDRGKSVVEPDRSQYKRDDMNVTYRGSGSGKSTVDVGAVDDLIPPYDALKIDALSEQDQDEEDRKGDADMQDSPLGNELMIMEEDDLLGEELNQTENQEPLEQDISQPVFASEHGTSILMIEAKESSRDDGAGDEYAKAITRSATRSLFSSSQAVSRRASPRINAQTTSAHVVSWESERHETVTLRGV